MLKSYRLALATILVLTGFTFSQVYAQQSFLGAGVIYSYTIGGYAEYLHSGSQAESGSLLYGASMGLSLPPQSIPASTPYPHATIEENYGMHSLSSYGYFAGLSGGLMVSRVIGLTAFTGICDNTTTVLLQEHRTGAPFYFWQSLPDVDLAVGLDLRILFRNIEFNAGLITHVGARAGMMIEL